jgi:signal transduction histidine kinase
MSERNQPSEPREDNIPGVSFHQFSAGGETGQLIRAKDWSATSLGPINSWPRSLRNYLSAIQELPTPAIIFWGTDQTQIYNDGYSVIMGPRHPQYLGATFRECWPETYSIIDPWMQRVSRNGERVEVSKALIPLTRHGFTEESYFTFSFSPLRDDQDAIAGILQIVTDVTDTVLGERRARALHELSKQTVHARTLEDAIKLATDVLGQNTADLPFCLIYLVDALEPRRLVLSGSTGVPEGHAAFPPEIEVGTNGGGIIPEISRVISQRELIAIEGLSLRLGSLPGGPWPEAAKLAVTAPIASADQQSVVGVLISGISPRLTFDAHYRDFLDLVAAQLATLIGVARAYEDEKKRVEAMAELDRAKTAFFSNVSHEFRTPLTLLLGPVEDMLGDAKAPLPPLQRARLELVHHNTLRLLKLVNALLDFSRMEAGRMRATYVPTDLARFTAELASAFDSAVAKANLELVVDCAPLSEPAYVDREMWEKIVLNLVSNAFKFTLQGQIAVRLRQSDKHFELSVCDTGTGIASDQLPRIFERFHRVQGAKSRSHEGTGIGLSLVQELVKLHAGSTSVISAPGTGTTFTVLIPKGSAHLPAEAIGAPEAFGPTAASALAFSAEALRWVPVENGSLDLETAASDSATADTLPGKPVPGRILLADDNADMRGYVSKLLSPYFTVEAVVDGQAALERAREWLPDLVLSDVMMPRLNGFGLLRELRSDARTRTIPVILVSARAGEDSAVEGFEAGADDYLVKPFSARELLARVRTHLELARLRREWTKELERANQELEAFSYSVSHDLRAPLRAVDGFSRLLLEDHADQLNEQARHNLAHIVAGAKRMSQIIDDLLGLAQITRESLHKDPLQLTALARGVVAQLQQGNPAWAGAVEIAEGLMVRGDARLLTIALENLIGNAVKFTANQPEPRIAIGQERKGEETVFYVRDNGAGFDMAHAHKLFTPFQRLHQATEFEGTGVGLATVHRIITRHGGRIWAKAAVNQGATFFFTLGNGH